MPHGESSAGSRATTEGRPAIQHARHSKQPALILSKSSEEFRTKKSQGFTPGHIACSPIFFRESAGDGTVSVEDGFFLRKAVSLHRTKC